MPLDSVLITGAARGFGYALTRTFTDTGCQVFACARAISQRDTLQQLSDDPDLSVIPLRLDVTSRQDLDRARQLVQIETDDLDVLVNNAGQNAATTEDPLSHAVLGSLDSEAILDMFHINTVAPLLIVEAFEGLLLGGTARS